MRKEILDILQCPACSSSSFTLIINKQSRLEILHGTVACKSCRAIYPIRAGILDCLPAKHPWVGQARASYRKSREEARQKWTPAQLSRREHMDKTYTCDSRQNFDQLLTRIPNGPGWALDLGAGTGWSTALLAGRGYSCIALDISADNKLELAVEHFKRGVYFDRVLADMNRLPFRKSAISLVAASAALHHSYRLGLSVKEAARVLVLNGKMEVCNEPVSGLVEMLSGKHGIARMEEGVWETSPSIFTWRKNLLRHGFETEVFFPKSIKNRLTKNSFNIKHKFYLLARLFSLLAKMFPQIIFCRAALFAGHVLFGLPLSASARRAR